MVEKSSARDETRKQMEDTIKGLEDHVRHLEGDVDRTKDEVWRAQVERLEREVAQTRDFYLKKIETIKRGEGIPLDDSECVIDQDALGEDALDQEQLSRDVANIGARAQDPHLHEALAQGPLN